MVENNGREIIATIIDDIVAGRDYNALTSVQNVLQKNTATRLTDFKKDQAETMFKEKQDV
ncbi:MAG: hypothetical protein HOJ35_00040 [Bdellovibrionales bacterium]|jgi:hypothetical protein|nr:hypothetical protein [Bdellovibrionales bacterium]